MRSNLLKLLAGLAVGVFFVWLSARDWDFARLSGAMTFERGQLRFGLAAPLPDGPLDAATLNALPGWGFDVLWLFPFLVILTAIHALRVLRWKPLIDPIAPLPVATHNRIGAVGFMAMFLFPLRLGELVRPVLVKRAARGVRTTELLASVVVERVLDGLVVSLLLALLLAVAPGASASPELTAGATVALLVFVGASVLLGLARWQRDLARRLVEVTLGLVSRGLAARVVALVEAFLRGLAQLPSASVFAGVTALTLVYWALNGLGVWCMIAAFHLPIDLAGAYMMMACVVVGMMIPNSPGNAGTFWYFLLLPVSLYGLDTAGPQLAALGLVTWLMQLLQQSLFGLWFVARGQVTWARVLEATHEGDQPAPVTTGDPA